MQMKYDLLYLLRDEKAFEIGAVRRQCEMKVTDSFENQSLESILEGQEWKG